MMTAIRQAGHSTTPCINEPCSAIQSMLDLCLHISTLQVAYSNAALLCTNAQSGSWLFPKPTGKLCTHHQSFTPNAPCCIVQAFVKLLIIIEPFHTCQPHCCQSICSIFTCAAGQMLAALLQWPQATFASNVDVDVAAQKAKIIREVMPWSKCAQPVGFVCMHKPSTLLTVLDKYVCTTCKRWIC